MYVIALIGVVGQVIIAQLQNVFGIPHPLVIKTLKGLVAYTENPFI